MRWAIQLYVLQARKTHRKRCGPYTNPNPSEVDYLREVDSRQELRLHLHVRYIYRILACGTNDVFTIAYEDLARVHTESMADPTQPQNESDFPA
jgi:hypothetical protein